MNAFVVSGLVKRRAELAGEIERTHETLRKMVLDLENLEATILQFGRDDQAEGIPSTTRDIALELLVERALDKNDQRLLRLMTKRVGVALRGQKENGAVRCQQGPGQYMIWEINR